MHAKTAGFVPPKLKLIFVGGSMAGVQVKPLFPAESSEIDLTEMKKKKIMARNQIKSLFVPLYILYNLAEHKNSYQQVTKIQCLQSAPQNSGPRDWMASLERANLRTAVGPEGEPLSDLKQKLSTLPSGHFTTHTETSVCKQRQVNTLAVSGSLQIELNRRFPEV